MGGSRALVTTAGVCGLLVLSMLPTPTLAETTEVRFAQLYSLTYLPAYIVYEEKLIEKHAARLGIPAPTVTISKLSPGQQPTMRSFRAVSTLRWVASRCC